MRCGSRTRCADCARRNTVEGLGRVLQRKAIPAVLGFAVLLAILLGWWTSIVPSNDRDWEPDVARLAYAEIQGDFLTVRNVRTFGYRSETDYTPAYYDKTYDLSKQQSVDLVAVYWMGSAIAHTILSFGFDGGGHLAISIETRKENGEDNSTIKGSEPEPSGRLYAAVWRRVRLADWPTGCLGEAGVHAPNQRYPAVQGLRWGERGSGQCLVEAWRHRQGAQHPGGQRLHRSGHAGRAAVFRLRA